MWGTCKHKILYLIFSPSFHTFTRHEEPVCIDIQILSSIAAPSKAVLPHRTPTSLVISRDCSGGQANDKRNTL
jgi:hypothetical protein